LSDADDQDFVERLSLVIWVEPTRDHLDGLAVTGSENSQQKEEKKRAANDLTTSEMWKCHGFILLN
jgi:hypothetical protein